MPAIQYIGQKTKKVISRYMQILFVALAFTLMVIASYLFVSDIERKHLMKNVKDAILNTEANIIADLKEPETILAGFAETIRGMIMGGETDKTVREYIQFINHYMHDNENNRLLGVTGFYGYFYIFGNRYFTERAEWIPPVGYDLQSRPWYVAAIEADGDIGVTEPYNNLRVGDLSVITFSRRIFDEMGVPLGVVCLDINLDRVSQHAVNTQFAENGYGFLLSQNRDIIAHPEPSVIGKNLRNVRSTIASYENEMVAKGYVYEVIATDYRGIESIVFLERLENGWYMGVVTPREKYYQSTRIMAVFLTVMGAILAAALIVILLAIFNELNKENEKSQAMAHWYNSILNAIPLPVTVTDEETKWTFINTAVEKFLGITFEDAIGKSCDNFGANICNTDDCGIVCARKGLKQTYFTDGDSSYQVDVAILKDKNDKTMGYIEIVQDITNLKMMTKKQADAEAANAAKSAFLAKVSHEIRTPMNAILGITEIQLRNGDLPTDTRNALDKIYNSGYMLLGIINDILDLSKIESGKLELFPIEYDFPSLINDTVVLNVVRYESKPITFSLNVDENIPLMLLGDELRIKQILNNLLSNAFKYTAAGEVKMSVFLESSQEVAAQQAVARQVKADNISLVFRISDTGQGMTPEQVNKLFDEYMRFNMEMNRAVEGAGLGMSITKHLVNLMGGKIEVESTPGKGSVFTIRLPQKTVPGSGMIGKELAEKIGQMSPVKTAHTKKAPIIFEYMPYGRVLIVDDVETNLYVTRGLISPYGLSVETASSGYEAIEKIKKGLNWDVIFMDHFMPGMDGVEAARIIRSMGYVKPIVALTANVISGQAEMFFANGFDDFLSKPIDIRQLDIVLNRLIRDRYPPETIENARKLKSSIGKIKAKAEGVKPELAKIFTRDAEKAICILEAICKKEENYGDGDIQLYVINAHSMKSALANIGEKELSSFALKLEEAGRKKDADVIKNETPAFLADLRKLIEKMNKEDGAASSGAASNGAASSGAEATAQEAVAQQTASQPAKLLAANDISDEDFIYLLGRLAVVKGACSQDNKKKAKEALAQIHGRKYQRFVMDIIDNIGEKLLHSEFTEAAKLAEEGINKLMALIN